MSSLETASFGGFRVVINRIEDAGDRRKCTHRDGKNMSSEVSVAGTAMPDLRGGRRISDH